MTTYTLDANEFFVFKSESDILSAIQQALGSRGKVTTVERPYFTQYFTVSIEDTGTARETTQEKILQGMAAIGYDKARIVRAEGGQTSTNVIKEVARETADALSPIAAPIGRYVLTLAVVLVVALALILILKGGTKSA